MYGWCVHGGERGAGVRSRARPREGRASGRVVPHISIDLVYIRTSAEEGICYVYYQKV